MCDYYYLTFNRRSTGIFEKLNFKINIMRGMGKNKPDGSTYVVRSLYFVFGSVTLPRILFVFANKHTLGELSIIIIE